MVRVMVCHKQRLPEYRLAVAMRDLSEEVNTLVSDKIAHSLNIIKKLFDRFVPIRDRAFAVWPVIVRPFHSLIIRIPGEVEDVPLRDPHMLEQLPCRVRRSVGPRIDLFERKITQRGA